MEEVWKRSEWVLLLRCRFQPVIKEFYRGWFGCYSAEPNLESVCGSLFTKHISELLWVLCWCWCPCSYRMMTEWWLSLELFFWVFTLTQLECESSFSPDHLPLATILFVAILDKNRAENSQMLSSFFPETSSPCRSLYIQSHESSFFFLRMS